MTKKKLFIVDTIATYRMKYVVEAESLEHAYDEVTMRESGNPDDYFDEVSQKYLGESIIDGRQIKRKNYQKLLDDLSKDPSELSSHWMGKKLIREIKYD